MNEPKELIDDQIAYYEARAPEYDEWFLRRGRYDRGQELNEAWFGEVEEARKAVDGYRLEGDVLELAAGTGLWTEVLLRRARHVTAVDASPGALARNRERVGTERVTQVEADLFTWEPDRRYDAVFFSFWLSHVPLDRFAGFWDMVGRALVGGGKVVFVDSLFDPTSTAADHELPGPDTEVVERRLNDGRTYRVVKIFHRPQELEARLDSLGWRARVRTTPRYFLHGHATHGRRS